MHRITTTTGLFAIATAATIAVATAEPSLQDCPLGQRKVGNTCVALPIPEHGKLDLVGNDWDCDRGYRKAGNKCVEVVVPAHGKIDLVGNDWDCDRGYRKAGKKCVGVVVPLHGKIDFVGNDWDCERGYRKAGKKCVEVVVPVHGKIDFVGNDWDCERGYRRTGNKCVAMSEKEVREADERIAAIVARSRQIAEAACEIEGVTAEGDHAEIVGTGIGCDYVVADGPHGYYLLEWYGGHDPNEGDIIIGPINGYGFKDVCYPSHGEGRVYVDDYLLSKSRAFEELHQKCH